MAFRKPPNCFLLWSYLGPVVGPAEVQILDTDAAAVDAGHEHCAAVQRLDGVHLPHGHL